MTIAPTDLVLYFGNGAIVALVKSDRFVQNCSKWFVNKTNSIQFKFILLFFNDIVGSYELCMMSRYISEKMEEKAVRIVKLSWGIFAVASGCILWLNLQFKMGYFRGNQNNPKWTVWIWKWSKGHKILKSLKTLQGLFTCSFQMKVHPVSFPYFLILRCNSLVSIFDIRFGLI